MSGSVASGSRQSRQSACQLCPIVGLFNVRRLPERRGFSVGGDQTKALGERLEAPILMGLPYISEFIFIFILFVSLTCAEARCVIPLELAPAGLLPFHGADFGRNRPIYVSIGLSSTQDLYTYVSIYYNYIIKYCIHNPLSIYQVTLPHRRLI